MYDCVGMCVCVLNLLFFCTCLLLSIPNYNVENGCVMCHGLACNGGIN